MLDPLFLCFLQTLPGSHHISHDILVGVPFCSENDVVPLMKKQQVMIGDSIYHYGGPAKKPSVQEVFKVDSFLLRNKSAQVVLPGEFVEYSCKELESFNGDITIEPHSESPFLGNWPAPTVSRVINGTVRLENNLDVLVPLDKA